MASTDACNAAVTGSLHAADANKTSLDGQAFAAFGAAGIEHGAATTGFHANQKAMGTGAVDFGRLIGAFHGKILSRV